MNTLSTYALSLGYPGVFLVSFIASTLVPFANEIVVMAMPALGYETAAIITWATAGGYLGSLTNYWVGFKGTDFVFSRWIKVTPKRWEEAEALFQRYGNWVLFFAWLPFVGDPLSVVAGAFKVDWRIFSFWVITGKALRFVVLLGLVDLIW